jgi:phosphotransferase system, enzyme I, PtsP
MEKDNIDLVCSIGELSSLFTKTTNVSGFLQEVVNLVADHMNTDVCSVLLFEESSGELVLRATKGLNPDFINKTRLKAGEGLSGKVLQELKPICEGNAFDNPEYKIVPGLEEENYHSFLAVPIRRGLTPIGVLSVHDRQKNYFDERDIKALRAIASQLAATLENIEILMEIHKDTRKEEIIDKNKLTFIKGKAASGGIAEGSAYILGGRDDELFFSSDSYDAANFTKDDLLSAIKETENQLEILQKKMEEEYSDVASLIFISHLLMLRDEEFLGPIFTKIDNGVEPARAFVEVTNQYLAIFRSNDNPLLQEKTQDLKDLGHRVLQNMRCGKTIVETGCESVIDAGDYTGQIVIASELFPSELVKMAVQHAEGIILSEGGITAHVSILAKSLGIPVVLINDPVIFKLPEGIKIIIDGIQGNVFVDPDREVIEKFQILNKEIDEEADGPVDTCSIRKTGDGTRIKVQANINLLSEISTALKYKAEGIGLYRSEFPFVIRNDFPSEEEQYKVYRAIVEDFQGSEVVFRTLDIGGDKLPGYMKATKEDNPFLGLRGLRFSLQHQDIFVEQIRAMLRAGEGKNLKILLPMVYSLDEFLDAKELIIECCSELEVEKAPHNHAPLIGAMIELPSAVELASELGKAADFLSIGTNDLVMYLLGVDRTNEQVSDLYKVHHPAVLSALSRITASVDCSAYDLSVCGDAAANESMLSIFIGLGIRKFSITPNLIPLVEGWIQKIDIKKAEDHTRKILEIKKISAVERILNG